MSPPIRVLSDDLASQIAAGEVVERPSSVVKELVENALDARSKRVDVTIEGGGITLIEVADDGLGMSLDDAPRCLGRHATSKLTKFSDLEELVSYGFRGEALPSVASVSRLSVQTRSRSSEGGLLLKANGTTSPETSPVGMPVGTVLTVRDLFYNVPARRKFLRSSNTESGHVSDVVVDAALSRPDVSFTLTRDKRKVKNFPRVKSRKERVAQIMPGEELLECVGERGPLVVEAYLSPPDRARQGAGGLKIFVNERPVRDRALAATIAHAYGGALERGRYPRGVVYLSLPGRLVDVNVHPQKTEVRFADVRAVSDALYGVISRALGKAALGTTVESDGAPLDPSADRSARPAVRTPAASRTSALLFRHGGASARAPAALRASASLVRDGGASARPERPPAPSRGTPSSAARTPSSAPASSARGNWMNLRLLGLAKQTYLVCEGDDGIYVLDQHAAHERSLLAELRRHFAEGRVPSQAMLFPETVALSPAEHHLVQCHEQLLDRLGLEVRIRSEHSASIHSSPRLLTRVKADVLLKQVLKELPDVDRGDGYDSVLAELACAEAVRPGERLQRETAESLLRSLSNADFDVPCPHGRVIVAVTSLGDLERKAGRS